MKHRSAEFVRERLGDFTPRVAIVLGSGLSALAEAVESPRRIGYDEIPGFPTTGVAGHGSEFVAGSLEGVPVIVQSGRFHLYEGYSPEAVVLPVRLFAALGAEVMIVTNAAGGLRPQFVTPTLMLIADHINMMWRNPLAGPVQDGEERFPDMSEPYDRGLRALARDAARELGITLQEGVYAGVLGPSYETPAEIRMLAQLGADAVGMSTVPEVVVARAQGLSVLGIAAITNLAAGLSHRPPSHEDVLEAGQRMAGDLERLVRAVVRVL